MDDRKYKALEIYGGLFFFAGIIVLILGIISGIFYFVNNFWLGLLIIFATILTSLPLMAFNDLIELLIQLEEDNYKSSEYLRQLVHGKDKKKKQPESSETGLICTNCGSEVEERQLKCKKCKALLPADGAVKKVKKKLVKKISK